MNYKMEEARNFIVLARDMGHVVKTVGNWIEWIPPLPPEMLLESIDLSSQIYKIIDQEARSV